MKPSRKTRIVLGLTAFLLLALGLIFTVFPLRCVKGFIDENTGSQKGYSEWLLGVRTGEWYQESAVETFMRKEYPADLHQRWTPYQGDDKNILNMTVCRRHAHPGAVIKRFSFQSEVFGPYCAKASKADKKRLYDALETENMAEIEILADLIQYEYAKSTWSKP